MRAVIVAGLVCMSACGSAGDAPPRAGDAAVAVERWFAAVAAKDCDAVRAMTLPALDPATCDGLLQDFHGRQTRLLAVESSQPDSRLPGTFVVQTSVYFRHPATNKHRWMMRVERAGGTLKVHAP